MTDEQGGALPAAVVVAVHVPTGSRRETTTQRDGRYVLADLRSGGPYLLTVTMAGFSGQERRDIVVSAGEQRSVDFRLSIAALSEEVTVTAGSEIARLQKQAADHIVDVVSADSLGRFPDNNAAEALRRIPGVSMEIDQGEGRFVVVRGIDASLNHVTINGQIVGTPAEFGTRGVSMDSVPADLISRLEVTKAVRPDMDANAIGASINISTLERLRSSRRLHFRVAALRLQRDGRARAVQRQPVVRPRPRRASALGYRHRRQLLASAVRLRAVIASPTARGRARTAFFVPQNNAFFLYDVERQRQGINASLEFRPAPQQSMFLRFNHNLFTDKEGRQQTQYHFTRGTLMDQTPTSGRFSQGRATREYRDYTQKHLINALMLGGNHDLHSTALDWKLGGSRGQRRTPNRVDWEFRSAANAFPSTYDVSNPMLPIITPIDSFYSADAYPFRRVRFRNDLEREDVWTGEANLRRAFRMRDRSAYWKTGLKVVTRDKYQNRENRNYLGSTFTLADFGLGLTGPNDFFEGKFPVRPDAESGRAESVLRRQPGAFRRRHGDHAAELARAGLRGGRGCVRRVSDGRRRLHRNGTCSPVRGWRLREARIRPTSCCLPAVHSPAAPILREVRPTTLMSCPACISTLVPKQNVTLRFAWTNTIGRPSYAQLAPIRVLDDIQNEDGTFTGSLSSGNPDLEPYRSMNVDASFEYDMKSGLISVAPFYKRIRNPIYSR